MSQGKNLRVMNAISTNLELGHLGVILWLQLGLQLS
jgi:hypothetical protein